MNLIYRADYNLSLKHRIKYGIYIPIVSIKSSPAPSTRQIICSTRVSPNQALVAMADVGEACCTELRLGLGYHCSSTNKKPMKDHDHDVIDDGSKRRDDSSMVSLGLSFTVSSEEDEEKEEQDQAVVTALAPKNPKICGGNAVITSNCEGDNLDVGCRKKLRLSKDQSALLEETFKQHRTLTPVPKFLRCNAHSLLIFSSRSFHGFYFFDSEPVVFSGCLESFGKHSIQEPMNHRCR